MVRKRKKREDEQPPWCYYCDRVFSDEQTLVQHQKAKHFKVALLNTALLPAHTALSSGQARQLHIITCSC